jgi:hypothetical protein
MSTKIIKINRGDSYEFPVYITGKIKYDIPYMLEADKDVVYFAIMHPHQRFEDAIILQGYTSKEQNALGEVLIKIEPNDTRRLAPGVYYYTVKLQRGGTLDVINDFDSPDEVRTLIERTKFIVNE